MLIYHPNLNLICGRLCSIIVPSPSKTVNFFVKKKKKKVCIIIIIIIFFFHGDGMSLGVGAERLSGKAESHGR